MYVKKKEKNCCELGDMTNGIRAHVSITGLLLCSLYKLFLLILFCLVYNGTEIENSMAKGDEIYVDLQDEDNTRYPNAPFMIMLHRLEREMAELRSQNDSFSVASHEQEKLIRELTS